MTANEPSAERAREEQIYAPWCADTVDALNKFQRLGYVHEFTCPGHDEGDRTLVATRNGWICPNCDYRQEWAWAHMLNPPPNLRAALRATEQPAPEGLRKVLLQACPHCDFSCGQRGMDRCGKCDGTGAIYRVNGKIYPNTQEGLDAALASPTAASQPVPKMVECHVCGGSGFSGRGTGYDAVCSECDGQREFPAEQRGAAGGGEDELLERMDGAAGSMSEHCRQRLYPTWGELSDTAELLRMARSRLSTAEQTNGPPDEGQVIQAIMRAMDHDVSGTSHAQLAQQITADLMPLLRGERPEWRKLYENTRDKLHATEQERDRAVATLEPFAKYAEKYKQFDGTGLATLPIRWLRNAADALSAIRARSETEGK